MCFQNVDLGVGEVVFVQVGDLLEELESLGVVKEEGRECGDFAIRRIQTIDQVIL
jgi:hypothetical protein